MGGRTISPEEAKRLIEEEADYLPYKVINEKGKKEISEWLSLVAKNEQNIDAWLTEAEDSANNSSPGESIIIEMRGSETFSGNPETLRLDDECFDYQVYTDGSDGK